jgi:hypothetical protein
MTIKGVGVLRFINGLLDRLFVVAGAFLGSQVPPYMQQYTQRLAGHVDELQFLLEQMRHMAAYSNKNLDQYIYKFLSSSDPDFIQQGVFMQTIVTRWHNLSDALQNIANSSIWDRPFILLKNIDYETAKATLSSFQPGVSLTIEGLYYACLGLFCGFLFYQILVKGISLFYNGFRRLFAKIASRVS